MEIDWSNAPSNATHFCLGGDHIEAGWIYATDGYAGEFYRCHDESSMERIPLLTGWRVLTLVPRPSKIAEQIQEGIDDADAGRLKPLSEVKAKYVWDGKGLPPVGTVCEWHKLGGIACIGAEWTPVKIIAHITDDKRISPVAVYMPCEGNPPYVGQGTAGAFRPIRTPEQIAADEKAEAIEEIAKATGLRARDGRMEVAIAIYAAGYRKQVEE